MREYLLSVDDFNQPETTDDKKSTYLELVRLIMLEKNVFQTHPNMGVGIVSRYRYSYTTDIEELRSDISDQIATYLPKLLPVDVVVTETDMVTTIKITVDGTLYEIVFDKKTKTISDLI